MKSIKKYLGKTQEEFKGVSKSAMAIALTIETAVCVVLIGTLLVTGKSLEASNYLIDDVLDTNTDLEKKLYDAQTDADTYKSLYEKASLKISK